MCMSLDEDPGAFKVASRTSVASGHGYRLWTPIWNRDPTTSPLEIGLSSQIWRAGKECNLAHLGPTEC